MCQPQSACVYVLTLREGMAGAQYLATRVPNG